jgi:hypothetical protein
MEDRSSRRVRTLVTQKARRGLSANEIACALISMMVRSTCSNQRPNTLTQDRISQLDQSLLQRAAGPYIWVKLRNTQPEQDVFRCFPENGHWLRRNITRIKGWDFVQPRSRFAECVMEWRGPLRVRSVRPDRLFSQFLRCRLAPVRGSAIDGAASAVNRARTPARRGSSQGLCAVGRRMPCDARHFSLDGSIEMARRSSRSDESPVPYGSVDVRVLGSMQSVISLPSR